MLCCPVDMQQKLHPATKAPDIGLLDSGRWMSYSSWQRCTVFESRSLSALPLSPKAES